MTRGVSRYALASRSAATPTTQRRATQNVQSTRQWLLAIIFITTLLLPLPASSAARSASEAYSASRQPYAAWSCRGVYHVVRRGETIYSIARRYGTTAYRIAVCNGLGSYTVYVGQTLLVPTAR